MTGLATRFLWCLGVSGFRQGDGAWGIRCQGLNYKGYSLSGLDVEGLSLNETEGFAG